MNNEYEVKILKVVDGDTVDVDINLGFGIVLTDERVRIMGIDTPESRTSDKVEKVFGLAAKDRLYSLLEKDAKLITTEDKSGEDMKGKFGGSKEDTQAQHMINREKLLAEGVVSKEDYDAAVKLMEK